MTQEILNILRSLIVPILGILVTFIVKFIKTAVNQIIADQENETIAKYISICAETVISCVEATNQTYVEQLKKDNAFTKEAQEEAFNLTKTAVLTILSEDAKNVLSEVFGDLDTYLKQLIESTVNLKKN